MKLRLNFVTDMVDLVEIQGLSEIADIGSSLILGSMATHAAVNESALVHDKIPALARLAGMIGDAQVRNRGTLGGSIANNDPAADYPAALLALGAIVETSRRRIPADEFFVDTFETALDDDEIVTAVEFPIPERAAYQRFSSLASRFAIVGIFVSSGPAGVRVAATGAGSSVFRLTAAETALEKAFSVDGLEDLEIPTDTLVDDRLASADYRAHLIRVLVERAVEACV